jgi:hypothetical protein
MSALSQSYGDTVEDWQIKPVATHQNQSVSCDSNRFKIYAVLSLARDNLKPEVGQ